ncbi:biotin transporter BioY [Alkalihalobacterium elongatum]|uniref:biotin transporter BioY n=1 Tax=Alkalihalobacterium elongatum TaxID=2675466 RepID=UPI001C1FA905|nr:biotin transporter BioY [Alkalihalobacterium elongatum]
MKLKNMMYASFFVAVIAALGILPPLVLPISPVPITAQSLGVMLAGAILGARYGGLSLIIFVLLVAFGAPLLSGGRGGISVFLGPSGGYILSWPIAAFVIGYLVEKYWHKMNLARFILFNVFGGIIVIYAGGVTYLSFNTGIPWGTAAYQALIYIPGDIAKAILAAVIAMQIKKAYPLIKKANPIQKNAA